MNLVEEAMESYWGKKCPDFEKGCSCCEAWRKYDELLTSKQESNK